MASYPTAPPAVYVSSAASVLSLPSTANSNTEIRAQDSGAADVTWWLHKLMLLCIKSMTPGNSELWHLQSLLVPLWGVWGVTDGAIVRAFLSIDSRWSALDEDGIWTQCRREGRGLVVNLCRCGECWILVGFCFFVFFLVGPAEFSSLLRKTTHLFAASENGIFLENTTKKQ